MMVSVISMQQQSLQRMYVNFYLQNMLAKLLIEVLCLGKDSPDALRLLHYKAPKTARAVSGNLFILLTLFFLDTQVTGTLANSVDPDAIIEKDSLCT